MKAQLGSSQLYEELSSLSTPATPATPPWSAVRFSRPNNFFFHNRNDDKSWQHNRDFIFNREGSCDGQQSPVLAGSVKVTRIWLIISVRIDPQYERDWSPMEEAIVDTHCSTSADKWAFVSSITDSKRRGGELSIDCPKRRGRRGTRAVLQRLKRSICEWLTAGEAHYSRRKEAVCVCEPAWSDLTFSDLQHPLRQKIWIHTNLTFFSKHPIFSCSHSYPVICLQVLQRFLLLVGIWDINILLINKEYNANNITVPLLSLD